jgi:hypothetical protein
MSKSTDIEVAVKNLVAVCEKHEISFTGAIDDNELGLCAFESLNKKEEVKEGFLNIQTLIDQKGEIGGFLMELSRLDASSPSEPFAESSADDQAALYAKTNTQIYNTFH